VIPRVLHHLVRRVDEGAALPAGVVYRRLPDGESELVVSFTRRATTASWIGTRTQPLAKPAQPGISYVRVRFAAAGAAPLFALPMAELADRVVDVGALWPAPLVRRLADARDTAGVLDVLARRAAASEREPLATARVRAAVRAITAAERLPTARELADALGASERHLRRAFADLIGLSPKRFVRVVRFRRALALARRSAQPAWAAIAHQVGYFDQAHLIAEFRALAGTTPGRL
jgi:AraC-like DNA-binding protein